MVCGLPGNWFYNKHKRRNLKKYCKLHQLYFYFFEAAALIVGLFLIKRSFGGGVYWHQVRSQRMGVWGSFVEVWGL